MKYVAVESRNDADCDDCVFYSSGASPPCQRVAMSKPHERFDAFKFCILGDVEDHTNLIWLTEVDAAAEILTGAISRGTLETNGAEFKVVLYE